MMARPMTMESLEEGELITVMMAKHKVRSNHNWISSCEPSSCEPARRSMLGKLANKHEITSAHCCAPENPSQK